MEVFMVGTTHFGDGTIGDGTTGVMADTTVMAGTDLGDGIDGITGVIPDLDLAMQVSDLDGTVLIMDMLMDTATEIDTTTVIVDIPTEAMRSTIREEEIIQEQVPITADFLQRRQEVVLM